MVAAFIGGTAAFSWSLSTWIAFDNGASTPGLASNAGVTDTYAARLPVEPMTEVLPATNGHDD